MNIGIIGYGEIGSAIHSVLKGKPDIVIRPWDVNTEKYPNQGTLESVVEASDLIFLCIPSWTLRGVLHSVHLHLKEGVPLISLSKGIEAETCKTTDILLQEMVPGHPVGILAGPMIAEELMAGKHTTGIIGSADTDVRKLVISLFKGTVLHIRGTADVRGVALCGVLKNTYVLGLGIADGLELGVNAKGVLMSRAVKEMRQIISKLGGKASTVLSEAGLGDLFTTGESTNSRNHMVGIAIGKNVIGAELKSEGTMSIPCFKKLLADDLARLPFLHYLIDVTAGNVPASKITRFL
ncbi:MAG: NAD(P)H-dependent glycerol-3-phosphate dehydrogenase [Patescibacteria group bacterium]|jgi:glycerol-3-phosphate dehydrogenase (NAD(P)+)